jgi:hypothetical protein
MIRLKLRARANSRRFERYVLRQKRDQGQVQLAICDDIGIIITIMSIIVLAKGSIAKTSSDADEWLLGEHQPTTPASKCRSRSRVNRVLEHRIAYKQRKETETADVG